MNVLLLLLTSLAVVRSPAGVILSVPTLKYAAPMGVAALALIQVCTFVYIIMASVKPPMKQQH